jgi:hypothetical protein
MKMKQSQELSREEAKDIQSDVMKMAHRLKTGSYISSEDVLTAWDLGAEKHAPHLSGRELRSEVISANHGAPSNNGSTSQAIDSQLPLLGDDVPQTIWDIKARFERKLADIESEMSAEINAAIEKAQKQQARRKSHLYSGRWVQVAFDKAHNKYRLKGRGSALTKGGNLHVAYHEDRKFLNNVGKYVDRLVDFVLENQTDK